MMLASTSSSPAPTPPERKARKERNRPPATSRETVLVVEDEPAVAEAVVEILRTEGHPALRASDGQEALEVLGAHAVDLIVLDLRMPGMNGWQFRTIQRSHPRYSHIPVIAISADDSPQAEAVDADAYLKKPFDASRLLLAVERALLADGRRRLDEQLEEAGLLTTLGTVAATVGHEINNPLTYVLGNLELLEERLKGISQRPAPTMLAEMTEMLRDVRLGTDRIRDVVATMQKLSRSSDAAMPVDVARVVRTSLAMSWREVNSRALLRTDLTAVPLVAGNEAQLGQVVLNLLINAAQSIPAGSPASNEIRVSTARMGDQVVIEVSDTGGGIPPELQARVFDPFFTTKRRFNGTGIGLTVVRNIVAQHAGRIELSSQLGSGTTFRVFLPVAGGSDPQSGPFGQTEGDAGEPAGGLPQTTERKRVLLIDDEALVLSTMGRMLAPEYVVMPATNALEALRKLATEAPFHAIVCNIVMPHMNGMQFWAEVERQYPEASQRIIFATGAVLEPAVEAFRERIRNRWLDKPFSTEELLLAVRETVGRVSAET
jgi:signal transduction histidine kinase